METSSLAIFDNPVWNALLSGNSNLAAGNDLVKYFPADVAPFVGLKAIDKTCFDALADLIPAKRVIALVRTGEIQIPGQWKIILHTPLYQMIAQDTAAHQAAAAPQSITPSAATPQPADHSNSAAARVAPQPATTHTHATTLRPHSHNIVPLYTQHIPQMLSLTKLTNPGPFYNRTIEFGNYHGIFEGDQLVAMAGQRMHLGNYIEVSAVCTHPDHLGHGYATALILHLVQLIRAQSAIPFLHVRTDNAGAIKLYKTLGFTIHQEVIINIITR